MRDAQAAKQLASGKIDAGSRGSVTGGGHLDGITDLLEGVFVAVGFDRSEILRRAGLELPGYYRPTKKWDLVVISQNRLVAAIEMKSQVGPSFANNFNNRTEEAIGSAVDVWRAYEEGTFGAVRPWLGYVFLLEETHKSVVPVRVARGVFRPEPIFEGTSYKDRYGILCQRLVRERLYDAACFVTTSRQPDSPVQQPIDELSFANLTAAIAGRAAYI
ncbi:MAG: PaeR7I family type II restriction endonuclease [Pseudonocardia sp.]